MTPRPAFAPSALRRGRLAGSLLLAGIATLRRRPRNSPHHRRLPRRPPPLPPARGTLTVTRETAAAIRAAVKAPAGFTVTAFATPPVVNYPTCVTATHDGVVFVCVDRNGSLQADPGMGYIVRLVDKDRNGEADEYTVFAALDSPRGAVFDGETLYVSHPPFVTALRDTDGDGIADDRRTLVRGLGFGLDFRGADHTTNGLEMGIDGWLYVAVGDYGFVKATGSDGQEIQLRGGGNVRVRPDGTRARDLLARHAQRLRRGHRSVSESLRARQHQRRRRLRHPAVSLRRGATFGYPTLFRNFNDEVVPPLADYGTGSGTGMLYVHDSALPAPYGDTLYSVDWGKNAVFRHALQAEGRHVLRHAGGIHHRAPAHRHGHRRQLGAVSGELGGRRVPIPGREGRMGRAPHAPAGEAGAARRSRGRHRRATRGADRVRQSGDEPRGAGRDAATRPIGRANQPARAPGGRRNAGRTRGGDLHAEAARRIRCDSGARDVGRRSGRASVRASRAGGPPR